MTAALDHISNPSLTQRLVEILGARIVAGDLEATNAHELCEQYGVSRTVVREAVACLIDKGLIAIRQNTGTVAAPPEKWDLLDPDVLRWLAVHDESLAREAKAVLFALTGVPGRIAQTVVRRLHAVGEQV
jgi:DNA-binding FadR family transcriptional regulator